MASNRRAFLTATAVTALAAAPATAAPGPRPRPPVTARAALDALLAGNRRYAADHPRHPHDSAGRRHLLAAAQHPFAVIVGCVDSRVPPELVFDQGIGDLLCIRTAGQVLDEAVLGSIQYGVEELGVPLVLVLGHERCGAVAATLEHLRTGAPVPGHLELLVDEIVPAARRTRALPGDWAEHTMRAHAAWVRDAIRADPSFGAAHVEAARFDLDTGRVSLLP
ncbi:carbonic anhydrase [Streptomyces griseochromogenes]|uniref:Carbonic anhydrase n=1 Tax=Streptomyces griseochromogenes TaxID=68214 RepID=A0A1B1B9M9_9ACTN|nr:carbonic anhydrase [Streptomyces griseochromogenes]ANP55503.1 carbonic anhydrase [Streptomyces griseochromogenes]MBP2053545.1 carbonic anhydrase [Streptomyces griseochromogenes]